MYYAMHSWLCSQVFLDEVYGEIVITHPLLIAIIKTRQFQRLKDIKKLGNSCMLNDNTYNTALLF